MSDLWVFGYGSLMWRPGFPHFAALPATLPGLHRALAVYSWFHRGTEARPGLVLGLDRGGSCRGIAFRVAAADANSVIAYLREREQVTLVYREVRRPVRLAATGETVSALTYVIDRSHRQYAGVLDEETVYRTVAAAAGRSGPNPEYVINTVDHLAALGIVDRGLFRLAERLRLDAPPAAATAPP